METGLAPVSYTHLDVYKRQAYNRTLQRPGKANQIRPMEEWIVAVGKHPGIISGSVWVQVQAIDVYKRQLHHLQRFPLQKLRPLAVRLPVWQKLWQHRLQRDYIAAYFRRV